MKYIVTCVRYDRRNERLIVDEDRTFHDYKEAHCFAIDYVYNKGDRALMVICADNGTDVGCGDWIYFKVGYGRLSKVTRLRVGMWENPWGPIENLASKQYRIW